MARPFALIFVVAILLSMPLAAGGAVGGVRAKHARVIQLHATGHNAVAAEVAREALDLGVGEFGEEHPSTAALVIILAKLHFELEEWPEAERLYRRAAAIRATALGDTHPDTGAAYAGLGDALARQARFGEAETSYWDALHTLRVAAARDPHALNEVNVRARLYRAWAFYYRAHQFAAAGRLGEAESLYHSAIAVFESNSTVDRGIIVAALGRRAEVLRALGRDDEATELDVYADAVSKGRASCPAGLFTVC